VTLDAAYRGLFGSLKDFIRQPHDFIPETQTDIYRNFYGSPDWILHFSQEQTKLEKNREILLNVPPIGKRPKPASKSGPAAPDAPAAKQ
jgi:hypothetical protein